MLIFLAVASSYSWIVLGVSFFTALVGILTWRIAARRQGDERNQQRFKMNADLLRAEHEGWAALLSNLREQYEVVNNAYDEVTKEREELSRIVDQLREELADTRRELAATREDLRVTRSRVQTLERQLMSKTV